MPLQFLTEAQEARYGRYVGEPTTAQLARYFHLDEVDLALVNKRRRDYNRLGFALQLTTIRFLGTFLSDPTDVPPGVIQFVCDQLGNAAVDGIWQYRRRKATRHKHSIEIQTQYGYQFFNSPPWRFRLTRVLYGRVWTNNERPGLLFDFAINWLLQNKVLLPGVTTLSRLIAEIRERASRRLWHCLALLPSAKQCAQLQCLFEIPDGQRRSRFDAYRKGPVRVSGPAFNAAIERYKALKAFGLATVNFTRIPPVQLKILARHAGMISMYKIARMPKTRQAAMLVAFVRAFEVNALDDAVDVLDLLITDIIGEARRAGIQKRLRSLKDLDRSALVLAEACAILLAEGTQDGQHLKGAIFSRVSRDQLTRSVEVVRDLARPPEDNFQEEMVAQYGRVRLFLPTLLNEVTFQAAPAGRPVLDAFNYLVSLGAVRRSHLENAPLGIVTNPWKRFVYDNEGRVTRQGYTLCLLDRLQDALRRRDIYVEGSDRWGDPRAKLLQGSAWKTKRLHIYRTLGHPTCPHAAVDALSRQLDMTYKDVSARWETNTTVCLDHTGSRPSLTITSLDKLEEPPSLARLKNQVTALTQIPR